MPAVSTAEGIEQFVDVAVEFLGVRLAFDCDRHGPTAANAVGEQASM
jgi:hypothetical protein